MSDLTETIREKARLAIEEFSARVSQPMDYSGRSLESVDALLCEFSTHGPELGSETVSVIVELLGCYVLEVGYREFGGSYKWYEPGSQPVLIVGEPDAHIAFVAFDKVRGRLSGDEEDNIAYFYNGFAIAAASSEPGMEAFFM